MELADAENVDSPLLAVPHDGDITHGPLTPALFRLAAPAILAKVLHAALGLVAVFWVARLGAAAAAAVTTSFFASWVLVSAVDLTALGILAHVARHTGGRDRARAAHAASQGLVLGVWLGLVLAVVGWFASPWLFGVLGAEPAVAGPGATYLRILFLAAPFTFTYLNCEFLMRAAGDTRTPMLVAGLTVLVNATLDPLLIYGVGPFPRLEVAGAGVAAFVAQIVACTAFAGYALRGHPSFPFATASLRRLDTRLAASLLRIGFPGMAVGTLYSTIYLFMSGIAARFGTVEMAVLGLANRSESVTYLVTNGFGAATATMVGQNLGAQRSDRAERAAWVSVGWMIAYACATGVLLVFWPQWVLRCFTSDAAIIETGAPYLRILGYAQPLMAVEIVLEHAFSGAGDTLPPMLISVPLNLLRIPLILWVVHAGGGLLAIGWVLATTCIARGALAALWFRRGRWKLRQL
jgi:putative MATE family efflux protein